MLFGVGKVNSMIGKVMADAPLHFGDGSNLNPTRFYSRFAAIFRLTQGGAAGTLERAQFIGSASFHPDGLAGTDSHIAEYFNATKP